MIYDYEIIVAIDPGSNGGIAIYRDHKIESVITMKKKGEIDYRGIKDLLLHFKAISSKMIVGLEKVAPRPQDGQNMVFMRMDKLFENRSRLTQIIFDLEIDFIEIPPISWINALGLRKVNKDESKTDRKNRYKKKAAELYPYVKMTNAVSDAVLMVEFLKLKLKYDRNWFLKFKIKTYNNKLW